MQDKQDMQNRSGAKKDCSAENAPFRLIPRRLRRAIPANILIRWETG